MAIMWNHCPYAGCHCKLLRDLNQFLHRVALDMNLDLVKVLNLNVVS